MALNSRSWQLPALYPPYKPPTWLVVFLCPMEDAERRTIMTRLITVDPDWPDRPQAEMRRLVEVPWLLHGTPPPSAIFKIHQIMTSVDSVIFVDSQSRRDDSAIILCEGQPPTVARVPMNRANVLLSAAAKGEWSLSADYPQVLPESPPRPSLLNPSRGILPAHLADLHLSPSTITLVSLVHLSDTAQEEIQSSIERDVTIRNWPEHEPCSRAQLYPIFHAIKVCHDETDDAYALLIDHDFNGNPTILAAGLGGPHWASPELDMLELHRLAMSDVAQFWTVVWTPFAHHPKPEMMNGLRTNPSIRDTGCGTGGPTELVANPDNIPNSWTGLPVFILDTMTETERRIIREELLGTPDGVMWTDVSDQLESPDMHGLLAYFEATFDNARGPPAHFLAVDRKSLEIALTPADERDESEAMIIASDGGCSAWFRDDTDQMLGLLHMGYGYRRMEGEEAESGWINLDVGNLFFEDVFEADSVTPDIVYWSWINLSKDDMDDLREGRKRVAAAYYPERGLVTL
ncbi:hypothetical protein NUU61_009597 [Penicillium alfredii]|uniref:Uncharacterized protein n=1 Tax=Penicillium alfredii TaxID=1506179 RepID=A0A9W9EGD4_9EURO|nr:uncharacterized protein NUU61_009597 [Penicillium alfredii]KAJ5081333.1 hypothetical protein NUU61_009597 [Penicillium alfredii]